MSSVHSVHSGGACAIAAHSLGDSGQGDRPDWCVATLVLQLRQRRWAALWRHPVLRNLGVIVVARSAQGGMLFHDQSTWGEDSDDSDDESKCAEVIDWKFGPAKKSHA